MYIQRIQIVNFRNFSNFDVKLWNNVVVVGENNAGKSNLLYALRLILDPSLPDSARYLELSDFWDGLENAFQNTIKITITFADFEHNKAEHASVPKCFADEGKTSSISYIFGPIRNKDYSNDYQFTEDDYEWYFWCENTESELKDRSFQRFIPFEVLPVLRDVASDLESSQRSPLHRLIKRLRVDEQELARLSEEIDTLMSEIIALPPISALQENITKRFLEMVGSVASVDPHLGIIPTEPNRLLRYIRLFSEAKLKRYISEIGTGYSNIIYIVLLLLDFKDREASHGREERRATTIIGVEEPEAHLHPHLQRLVFGDLFRETEIKLPIFMTTHSPHIVSISPLKSLLLLKKSRHGTVGSNILDAMLTESETRDIERYLDVTRAELVFSSAVLLVEGIAEVYIITEFARLIYEVHSLDVLGISVVNVHGIDFAPYLKLLGKNGLDIPTAVVTDGDPQVFEDTASLVGVERCRTLAKVIFGNNTITERQDLNELGLFVGDHTLEIDLVDVGYQSEFLDVFRELGQGELSIQNTQAVFDNWDTLSQVDKEKQFIDKIQRIGGKGRVSQSLAAKLRKDKIPSYILDALNYIRAAVSATE